MTEYNQKYIGDTKIYKRGGRGEKRANDSALKMACSLGIFQQTTEMAIISVVFQLKPSRSHGTVYSNKEGRRQLK